MALDSESRKQNEAMKIGAVRENPQTFPSVVAPFAISVGRTPYTL
jgi:hypothetical protein